MLLSTLQLHCALPQAGQQPSLGCTEVAVWYTLPLVYMKPHEMHVVSALGGVLGHPTFYSAADALCYRGNGYS